MSKKGYAYFVELALAIIIIFIVLSSYFESEQTIFEYKQNENLRESGWYLLKNLDEFGALNSTNISKVNVYISGSLDEFTAYDLEIYNSTGCYPVDNGVVSTTNYTKCPAIGANTKANIISTFYTYVQNGDATSFRLYLWRKI